MSKPLLALLVAASAFASAHAADPAPLKVLLLTGGCCHDYKTQKDILKTGLQERANVVVEQIHVDDHSTKPPLPIYGNPDYAKGFDLVIHDECAADIKDPEVIKGVLKPHRDGIPGVNLHCAMHCYRFGDFGKPVPAGADNAGWYEYLGLQSSGHGPQQPIAITFVDENHPIVKGFAGWTTINEELYNNIQILTGHPLARGKQTIAQKSKDKDGKEVVGSPKEVETVVAWTNEYGDKKTRVFSTTIGHNNETVSDPRYLDMVARGVLWATGHLEADGKPSAGYGKTYPAAPVPPPVRRDGSAQHAEHRQPGEQGLGPARARSVAHAVVERGVVAGLDGEEQLGHLQLLEPVIDGLGEGERRGGVVAGAGDEGRRRILGDREAVDAALRPRPRRHQRAEVGPAAGARERIGGLGIAGVEAADQTEAQVGAGRIALHADAPRIDTPCRGAAAHQAHGALAIGERVRDHVVGAVAGAVLQPEHGDAARGQRRHHVLDVQAHRQVVVAAAGADDQRGAVRRPRRRPVHRQQRHRDVGVALVGEGLGLAPGHQARGVAGPQPDDLVGLGLAEARRMVALDRRALGRRQLGEGAGGEQQQRGADRAHQAFTGSSFDEPTIRCSRMPMRVPSSS
jgi:hypothetical protein